MRQIDRVIITDRPFWRITLLACHRKRRVRKKYERTLFVRPADMQDLHAAVALFKGIHHNGKPFTDKGTRSAVRAMRKAGHHDVRAVRR